MQKEPFRQKLLRFMAGRNGADHLCIFLTTSALVITLIGMITGWGFLSFFSTALLWYSIFRMFSRNLAVRRKENAWFTTKYYGYKTKVRQMIVRFKNRKEFAYFSCPQCRTKLRLPRGAGNVRVTCKKCGHAFDKKV